MVSGPEGGHTSCAEQMGAILQAGDPARSCPIIQERVVLACTVEKAGQMERGNWKDLVMSEGERDGTGRVTAVGKAGGGGKLGPGEGACEALWGMRHSGEGWGSALPSRWRASGPAVGLPQGVKIPSAAELFSRCLSVVTASAGPWQVLKSQAALLAAQEAGNGEP